MNTFLRPYNPKDFKNHTYITRQSILLLLAIPSTVLIVHLEEKHKIKKPIDDIMTRKCKFCQEKINLNTISKHENSCKTFYQFMKKTLDGYKCNICSSVHSKRSSLHKHLEEKHKITRTIDSSHLPIISLG